MSRPWGFLTNHAKVLICVANDRDIRVREIAAEIEITERAAHRILVQLVTAGYLSKERRGRRTRYAIQRDLPLKPPLPEHRVVGELLDVLIDPEPEGLLEGTGLD